MMETFRENNKRLKTVYFRKKVPSHMFERVLNTLPLCDADS